jgi:soluble lytic murein transglycosylase-like protein
MKAILKVHMAAAVLALSAHAHAEIWGYVDEAGVAHFSSYQVDERYYLFRKDPPPSPRKEIAVADPEPVAPLRASSVNPVYRKQYTPLVTVVAKEHGLDAALLHAVITVESGYNPLARSPKGAIGLMQLLPETAERYAVRNVWDPKENLRGGAKYLRDLLVLFNNNLSLALAAYNAGEGAVMVAGNRIPPFAETRSYVPKVLAHYERYRSTARR